MKPHWFLVVLVAAAGGCMTSRSPSDLAHIEIDHVSSSRVRVERSWMLRDHDQIFVAGNVVKQLGDPDTTATHLDVRVIDGKGKVLGEGVVQFLPRRIPHGHRMHGHSSFLVLLEPLPAEAAVIEIEAHESGHVTAP